MKRHALFIGFGEIPWWLSKACPRSLRRRPGRFAGGTPEIQAVLAALPRVHPYVFTNVQTGLLYTRAEMAASLRRAKQRAGITITGRAFHLLRHALATRLVAGWTPPRR